MPLIPKPNYNQIFASQAPDIDKPAVFNNYPEGWGPESRPNNGKPTIKGFNYLQQTSDLKDLWILQNGACLPYDESIEYAEGAPVLKDGELQQWSGGEWKSVLPFEDGVLADTLVTVTDNSKISTPINQHLLTDTLLGATYYADLNGFKADDASFASENVAAWDAIMAKMSTGDRIKFGKGSYYFSEATPITKVVDVVGASSRYGTAFVYTNPTNGIERRAGGAGIYYIRITGKQTSTVLDPWNKVLGTIGLYDVYKDGASSGYAVTDTVRIGGFDTGRANITEGVEVWNGAYRETYNTWIQSNRIGCVFLNGSTDDKYYGGIISANTEIGIWSYAIGGEIGTYYNNIKFIGTTIEGNGYNHPDPSRNYSSGAGYGNATRTTCGIYSGGSHSNIYLIGSYEEAQWDLAEAGGSIHKVASYQHRNSIDASVNGHITYSESNLGYELQLPVHPNLGMWFYGLAGGALVTRGAKLNTVTFSAVTNSYATTAFRSNLIKIPKPIKADDVSSLKLSMGLHVASGVYAGHDLNITIMAYLYDKSGGYIGTRTWSSQVLSSITEGEVTISTTQPCDVSDTGGQWELKKGSDIDYVELSIGVSRVGGGNMDFRANPLSIIVSSLDISLFCKNKVTLPLLTHHQGTEARRPLLNSDDIGFRYYQTDTNNEVTWGVGRWLPTSIGTLNATSAYLASKAHEINIRNKGVGTLVYNVSNQKLYYATGPSPTDLWVSTDNVDTVTPV